MAAYRQIFVFSIRGKVKKEDCHFKVGSYVGPGGLPMSADELAAHAIRDRNTVDEKDADLLWTHLGEIPKDIITKYFLIVVQLFLNGTTSLSYFGQEEDAAGHIVRIRGWRSNHGFDSSRYLMVSRCAPA